MGGEAQLYGASLTPICTMSAQHFPRHWVRTSGQSKAQAGCEKEVPPAAAATGLPQRSPAHPLRRKRILCLPHGVREQVVKVWRPAL